MTDIYFAKNDVHFTKTEKKLIDYIIASPQDFVRMSIGDVARCIGSSEPTVSRFARHCGYDDFKGLKNAVFEHISGEGEHSPAGKLTSTIGKLSSNPEDGPRSTPDNFLRSQQLCIEKTLSFLDPDALKRAVSAITGAAMIPP